MSSSKKRLKVAKVPFAVAGRVVRQLGRESISSSIVAIIELVKNAYDADAENVDISFVGLDSETPQLIISDDGVGMSEEDLQNKWMVIGNSTKRDNGKSKQKDRVLTGEKGLGRLGLDRLSRHTVVRSFPRRQNYGVELEIDWTLYDSDASGISRIKHPIYRVGKTLIDPTTNKPKRYKQGTQLILSNLRDSWATRAGKTWEKGFLEELRRELSLLVSPFLGTKDFSISLYSGLDWSDTDGEVTADRILQAAEWQLTSEITTSGKVRHFVRSKLLGTSERFRATEWTDVFKDSSIRIPRCGPLKFEMYFFRRKSSADIERAKITDYLNANQGIRIYRDNFRVRPYGEPTGEGDWLRLSYRRQMNPSGVADRSGQWRVGYNQVVGAVFIGRDTNPDLVDQTNRERLVEGGAFFDLRKFATHAIEFFESTRQDFEASRRKDESIDKAISDADAATSATKDALKRFDSLIRSQPVSSAPKRIRDELNELRKVLEESTKAQEKLAKASDAQRRAHEREKNTLANLASLGILTAAFGHETIGSSNMIITNAQLISMDIKDLFFANPDTAEQIRGNVQRLIDASKRVATFAKFTLGNVGRDKRRRRQLDIGKIAESVLAAFQDSFDKEKIDIKFSNSGAPVITGFEIDWESIFVNFITNSVWALKDTTGPSRKRIIRCAVKATNAEAVVEFADNGRGLERGTERKIFRPTFSTRRNAKGESIGTGMGLAIVKDFVESHGGRISAKSKSDLGGAQFTIKIPKGKKRGRKAKASSTQ